jgi:hypothetical protein
MLEFILAESMIRELQRIWAVGLENLVGDTCFMAVWLLLQKGNKKLWE